MDRKETVIGLNPLMFVHKTGVDDPDILTSGDVPCKEDTDVEPGVCESQRGQVGDVQDEHQNNEVSIGMGDGWALQWMTRRTTII